MRCDWGEQHVTQIRTKKTRTVEDEHVVEILDEISSIPRPQAVTSHRFRRQRRSFEFSHGSPCCIHQRHSLVTYAGIQANNTSHKGDKNCRGRAGVFHKENSLISHPSLDTSYGSSRQWQDFECTYGSPCCTHQLIFYRAT